MLDIRQYSTKGFHWQKKKKKKKKKTFAKYKTASFHKELAAFLLFKSREIKERIPPEPSY